MIPLGSTHTSQRHCCASETIMKELKIPAFISCQLLPSTSGNSHPLLGQLCFQTQHLTHLSDEVGHFHHTHTKKNKA